METAECWELAIRRTDGPSLLVLTRQALPTLRTDTTENRCARGGYVLAEADGPAPGDADRHRLGGLDRHGRAREALAAEGIAVAVVSLPCWELFAQQDEAYRAQRAGRRAAGRHRGRRRLRLGALAGPRRHVHRHDRLRRLGAVTRIFTSISVSRRGSRRAPRSARRLRLQRPLIDTTYERRNADHRNHGREGRHQRIWTHRAPGAARHGRERARRHRAGRDQRSRQRRGERASVPLRQRAWPLPRPGRGLRRHHHHPPQRQGLGPDQGVGRARSDQGAVPGRRCRDGVHRHLHQQGEGLGADRRRARARC